MRTCVAGNGMTVRQFVAVRQQATEASSAGSRRACVVRSCQAASHRGEQTVDLLLSS